MSQKARVTFSFADKVEEADHEILIRPMGWHPFGGCQTAFLPTVAVGVVLTGLTWLLVWPRVIPIVGAGWTYLCLYASYHLWNYRRKLGRHDSIIDLQTRRIRIRDSRTRRRIAFDFADVLRLKDVHEFFPYEDNLHERIDFELATHCRADQESLSRLDKASSHPMSLWLPERCETGFFGDMLARWIGCAIEHHGQRVDSRPLKE